MDWIHCNACYIRPSFSNEVKLCLSSCGHLFCINCAKASESHCRVCKKDCRYVEVNRTLRQDLQMFFKDPIDVLKNNIRKIKSISDFQTFHRLHLGKHLNERICKRQITEELKRRMEKEKNLQTELQQQIEANRNLKKMISEKDNELNHWRNKYSNLSSTIANQSISSHNTSSPGILRNNSSLGHNRSVSGVRLVSLDSPIAFSGRASNSSFVLTPNLMMNQQSSYQQINSGNLKPTILASYSASSKSSHNSTNSDTFSHSSTSKSVIMPGRITKGSVLPRSTNRQF